MRSFIVGTAGHIDHGKSALVRALTGTDPDRLKEEKERGITIDLGFAHTLLSPNVEASFVDVPGHERFVRNMLAGAHGLDAVVLVVAADESVMPQTREHFHICSLLGLSRGLVVLSKCDVADAEMQKVAEMEVRELLTGSFLEGCPVLRVSARTGLGLEALRRALLDLAHEAGPRASGGLLRLPVDRVFTLKGFGTVVTGTLITGEIGRDEDVVVLPRGARFRVRGLEVHGQGIGSAGAGTRVALNLAGAQLTDVERGDVVARDGSLLPGSLIDVEMALLPSSRGVQDGERLRVHVASAEVLGRVRILGASALLPGGTGLAQLRLESPAVAAAGDRLVIRSYSPAETIGGARVLDPHPPRRKTKDAPSVRRLAEASGPAGLGAEMVRQAGVTGVPSRQLAARLGVPIPGLHALLGQMEGVESVGDGAVLIHGEALADLAKQIETSLSDFHGRFPLRDGMPRRELRGQLSEGVPEVVFDFVLSRLEDQGRTRGTPTTVALAAHEVRLTDAEARARGQIIDAAHDAGLEGLEPARLARGGQAEAAHAQRMVDLLLSEGQLVRLGGGLVVSRDHLATLIAMVRSRYAPGSPLDVSELKQITGLSRKYVIPLLEFLDRERVTRRSGDARLVLPW